MSDTQAQFSVLKQTADPAVADANPAADRTRRGPTNSIGSICWIFQHGPDSMKRRGNFRLPHASRLGLFDLTWNVLCPGCGGVLDAHSTLKSLRHDDYQLRIMRLRV